MTSARNRQPNTGPATSIAATRNWPRFFVITFVTSENASPCVGTTLNDRNQPFTRRRYALEVNNNVTAINS